MKIAVLGGDGFVGWPTSLHLSDQGHEVHILDNLSRRWIDTELGVQSLTPMDSIQERTRIWHQETGRRIRFHLLDLASDYEMLKRWLGRAPPRRGHPLRRAARRALFDEDRPPQDLHRQQQRQRHPQPARRALVETELDAHLVHLGTMGVYGYSTVGAAIPEGYLPVGDRDARRRDASTRRSSTRPVPARSTT